MPTSKTKIEINMVEILLLLLLPTLGLKTQKDWVGGGVSVINGGGDGAIITVLASGSKTVLAAA